MAKKPGRYQALIEKIFFDHYTDGATEFVFDRTEIKPAADFLDIELPANLGDVIYSFRFRTEFPQRVIATQPDGMEWVIELAGRGRYRFNLLTINRVFPRKDLVVIDIPDATPELIRAYALDDEQALLAIVRYNRLIDTFLGLTTYSLQNHLRTTVQGMGQIEIDELYIGLDKRGLSLRYPRSGQRGYGPHRHSPDRTGHPFRRAEIPGHALPCHRCPVHGGHRNRAVRINTSGRRSARSRGEALPAYTSRSARPRDNSRLSLLNDFATIRGSTSLSPPPYLLS